MGAKDLSSLLEYAREWNQEHHVTGMLLYIQGKFVDQNEGRFIQVLEGQEEEVRNLFNNIRRDSRHRQVTLLQEVNVKNKNFKTWTMGFERMTIDHYTSLQGSFDLNNRFLTIKPNSHFNSALPFLQSFYAMSLKS